MLILEKFCHAFKDAITDYETEMNGNIPVKRQPTVVELRRLLEDFQREECDRIVLLSHGETIPSGDAFDKSTIYLLQEQETIQAHWHTYGCTESVLIRDPENCQLIKAAFEARNALEKSNALQSFNRVIGLCDYRPRKLDSLGVREKMSQYLETMPASLLAFIQLFESRLRIKLKAVLAKPYFSEFELSAAERREIKDRQALNDTKTRTLVSQVTELAEALTLEQAKDNVQKVNALWVELDREKKTTAFLTQENTGLQQSVNDLFDQCTRLKTETKKLEQEKTRLQTDYDDLKARYEALLQETPSSDAPKPKPQQGFFG